MKVKSKREFKQAEKFLTELKSDSPEGFDQLNQLLVRYDLGELSKEVLFEFLLREIKSRAGLLGQLNLLLAPERQVLVVSRQGVNEMFEFLLHELHLRCARHPKFDAFIDCLHAIITAKLDKGCFTSYEELVELIRTEVGGSAQIRQLDPEFAAHVQEIMALYSAKISRDPPELVSLEKAAFQDPAPAKEEPPSTTGAVAPPRPKKGKAAPPNGSSGGHFPAELAVEAPAAPAEEPAPPPAPEPGPPAFAEPPVAENLKVDEQVFAALRRKLGAGDYATLVKNLYLYYKSVISYFEFVRISETLLLGLDKELCLALRDLLEAREASRTRLNPFNIKTNLEPHGLSRENRSYKRIVNAELLNQDSGSLLINKTYFATAHGNESAVNVADGAAKRVIKNVSEETLFSVEDEIHEFNSVIQQFRVALGWLDRLARPGLGAPEAALICRKLANLRVLALVYSAREKQILEELLARPPELLAALGRRLAEKLDLLLAAKEEFARTQWRRTLSHAFFKALDSRSSSVKFAEKSLFVNKDLIGRLKEARPGERVLLLDSIGFLLGHERERLLSLAPPPDAPPSLWNPVACFRVPRKDVLADIVGFLRQFVKTSKLSLGEKEKSLAVIQKIFCGFLGIPEKPRFIETVVAGDAELRELLQALERRVFPQRPFHYSEKLRVPSGEPPSEPAAYQVMQRIEEREARSALLAQREPGAGRERSPDNGGSLEEEGEGEASQEYESEFEKLLRSESSGAGFGKETVTVPPEAVRAPRASRSFVSSYQFYLTFRYFVLLCERFQHVLDFSLAATGSEVLYQLFKQLLGMNLTGALAAEAYEDCVRILFDFQGGVLLNLEKILHTCSKHLPGDEFAGFVFALNADAFGEEAEPAGLCEEVRFAKTCQKLAELIAQSNKNYKANSLTTFNSTFAVNNNELLKFEFDPADALLVVHKLRSIYNLDSKASVVGLAAFVEETYPVVARSVPLAGRLGRVRKAVQNKLVYSFNSKSKGLSLQRGGVEDLIAGPGKCDSALKIREKRIRKLGKAKAFREKRLQRFRDIN